MPVTLPISDAYINSIAPLYAPGECSLTQQILEEIMARDFPTVAVLGIERYCERLLQVAYTDGTLVFYLDWTPSLPGYVVAYLEPWTSGVAAGGQMSTHIILYSGPEAARRAEQVRRLIPPGETCSGAE